MIVRAQADDGEVVVEIEDHGPGIAPDRLQEIFERFAQVNVDLRQSTKGFGLGLNIAQELVDLNFGHMAVCSELGQGSTFSFSIPLAQRDVLLDRYLSWVKKSPQHVDELCGLRVTVKGEHDHQEEFHELLQAAVCHNDLVLDCGESEWFLLVNRPRVELPDFLQRAAEILQQASRNRPQGPLPELQFTETAGWSLLNSEASQQISQCLNGRSFAMRKPTILIVDDDCAIARGVGLRLKAVGCETLAAYDGEQAIESAVRNRPDAVVLDVRMPKLDGLSALRKLRTLEETEHIPVVMLSASLGDKQTALQAGAKFFLSKPFRSHDLLAAIRSTLSDDDTIKVCL